MMAHLREFIIVGESQLSKKFLSRAAVVEAISARQ